MLTLLASAVQPCLLGERPGYIMGLSSSCTSPGKVHAGEMRNLYSVAAQSFAHWQALQNN